jgi:hypothetical protein
VWQWILVNPDEHADKPPLLHPDPRPPTTEEAARLVKSAWSRDPTGVHWCGSQGTIAAAVRSAAYFSRTRSYPLGTAVSRDQADSQLSAPCLPQLTARVPPV